MTDYPYSQEAATLADSWCFLLTRRRFGSPRDLPGDMAFEFQNLLDLGFSFGEMKAEIERRGRDRSEYMWQFRDRMKLRKFGDPRKPGRPPETPEELEGKRRRQVAEREQAERERRQAAASRTAREQGN